MNLKKKKEKIKKIIKNKYTETNIIIYFLLINHKLDNIIGNLDNIIVIPEIANTTKKGYLTSEEQLVVMLQYLIDTFNNEFWFIKVNRNIILDCLINSDEAKHLLYSKKYFGDNRYIDDFFAVFQRITTNILKKIINNSAVEVSDLLEDEQFKNLDDPKVLYHLLKLICLCNSTSYQLVYLFDTHYKKENQSFYTMQLEILLNRTCQLKNEALDFINNSYF